MISHAFNHRLYYVLQQSRLGSLSAGRRNMDWFSVMLVASATAIGGGSVRDILLVITH